MIWLLNFEKITIMKKVTPLLAACLIAGMLYAGSSSCHKKKSEDDGDCKFCKAFGPDLNVVDSATVCSESAENAFRSKNAGRQIKCN
jgi:hypothetical protein